MLKKPTTNENRQIHRNYQKTTIATLPKNDYCNYHRSRNHNQMYQSAKMK